MLFILLFFIIGIVILIKGDPKAIEPFIVGIASVVVSWLIYGIIRWIIAPMYCWIVKGFHQGINSDTQK